MQGLETFETAGAGHSAALMDQQSEMMDFIKQQWRIVNQDCQRLLTGSDEYPELHIDQSMGIYLTPKQKLYYRVEIKGAPSPLRCEIKYNNIEAKVSNLDILISSTN